VERYPVHGWGCWGCCRRRGGAGGAAGAAGGGAGGGSGCGRRPGAWWSCAQRSRRSKQYSVDTTDWSDLERLAATAAEMHTDSSRLPCLRCRNSLCVQPWAARPNTSKHAAAHYLRPHPTSPAPDEHLRVFSSAVVPRQQHHVPRTRPRQPASPVPSRLLQEQRGLLPMTLVCPWCLRRREVQPSVSPCYPVRAAPPATLPMSSPTTSLESISCSPESLATHALRPMALRPGSHPSPALGTLWLGAYFRLLLRVQLIMYCAHKISMCIHTCTCTCADMYVLLLPTSNMHCQYLGSLASVSTHWLLLTPLSQPAVIFSIIASTISSTSSDGLFSFHSRPFRYTPDVESSIRYFCALGLSIHHNDPPGKARYHSIHRKTHFGALDINNQQDYKHQKANVLGSAAVEHFIFSPTALLSLSPPDALTS